MSMHLRLPDAILQHVHDGDYVALEGFRCGIIHAQKADREGNVFLWGIVGVQKEIALAAKRVIVTVEETVESLDAPPNACVLPAWVVTAVYRMGISSLWIVISTTTRYAICFFLLASGTAILAAFSRGWPDSCRQQAG